MHTARSTYSFIRYPCAMERPLPLEISGVASQDDANAYVVYWVHRDADEGIRRGFAAHCSLRGSCWHYHMKVMA